MTIIDLSNAKCAQSHSWDRYVFIIAALMVIAYITGLLGGEPLTRDNLSTVGVAHAAEHEDASVGERPNAENVPHSGGVQGLPDDPHNSAAGTAGGSEIKKAIEKQDPVLAHLMFVIMLVFFVSIFVMATRLRSRAMKRKQFYT